RVVDHAFPGDSEAVRDQQFLGRGFGEGLTSVHAGTTVPSRRTRSPASGAGSAQECGPEELHDVLLASREGVRGERCDVEQTLEERLVGEVAEQRSVPRDEELSSVLALER